MNQLFHILKKDLRGMAGEVGVFLATIGISFFVNQSPFFEYSDLDLFQVLPMLAGSYLTARVIHSESLVGSSAFWITRPYRWTSLFGAKILFLLVAIHLPLLVTRAAVLNMAGFPIFGNLPGLLWSQFLLVICISLPTAAIASVTRGLAPFIGTVLGGGAVLLMLARFSFRRMNTLAQLDWVRGAALAIVLMTGALLILCIQYRRRSTLVGRGITIGMIVTAIAVSLHLPFSVAWAVQSAVSSRAVDPYAIEIWLGKFAQGPTGQRPRSASLRGFEETYQLTTINIPLTVRVKPVETRIQAVHMTLVLRLADGREETPELYPEWREIPTAVLMLPTIATTARLMLPASMYRDEQDRHVTLRGTVYVVVYSNAQTVTLPITSTPVNISNTLRCGFPLMAQTTYLECRSALRFPLRSFRVRGARFIQTRSFSPLPAQFGLNPVEDRGTLFKMDNSAREVTLESDEPVAFIKKDFEFPNILLKDYRPE